jgi:hypothetical protein
MASHPIPLSAAQMDQVTAGLAITYYFVSGQSLILSFPVSDGVSGEDALKILITCSNCASVGGPTLGGPVGTSP